MAGESFPDEEMGSEGSDFEDIPTHPQVETKENAGADLLSEFSNLAIGKKKPPTSGAERPNQRISKKNQRSKPKKSAKIIKF